MKKFMMTVGEAALLTLIACPVLAQQLNAGNNPKPVGAESTLGGTAPVGTDLAGQFAAPPDSAKPSGWWFWFYNLMDKEGITRDLTEFKAKGMGSAQIICAGNDYGAGPMPSGPAFLSPEWRELYRHALREADRLGLKIGITLCSAGWDMGGPWITKDNGCRWFLQSQLTVTGPQRFSGPLPLPGNRDGYDGAGAGNVPDYINLPLEQLDYRDSAIVAFPEPENLALPATDERRASLQAKSNRKDSSIFGRPPEIMGATLVPWTSKPQDRPLRVDQVVDLTKYVTSDGKLEWDVPPGRWTILRTGHRLTGATIRMPTKGFEGLEVDRFSAAAVDQQFENLGKILIEEAGPLAGKTLTYFTEDSFEAGFPNWTAEMLTKFKEYRGYDPRPYLPVFSGRLVGSAEMSDRFLYDYRKTAADCMADGHYGRFTELANKHGLQTEVEAAGPSWSATVCSDALKNLGRCDVPMGEFWMGGGLATGNQNWVTKQASSAAHIYGRRRVAAEAFTGGGPWTETPGSLKPIADIAFCEGINRLVFHTTTGTRPQDGKPGYQYGAGMYFNPNVTWWEQAAGPWLSYVNRCQTLLQSGLFVADVLYYNGDWAPNMVMEKHVAPALGKGYDYDVCNAEVLLTRLSVKDGRLVLPDGMSYRLLVLPESKRMPVEVVQKIRELVKAGATVVGPKPESDPGLKNYPQCDAEVKQIADEVWGACDGQKFNQRVFGKGRIFWGKPLRDILLADGVQPDFAFGGKGEADAIPFAGAAWIWDTEDGVNAPAATRLLKTEVEYPTSAKLRSATVEITADDAFELLVNGESVLQGDTWQRMYSKEIAARLHGGTNQLLIKAVNTGPGSAGVIAKLTVRLADGQTLTHVTGCKDWLSSKNGEAWAPALEIGAYGCQPWGQIQSASKPFIDFIHRATADTDIYFVANRNAHPEAVEATFRVSGRQPELWDPVSGKRRDLSKFDSKNGRTTVPLEFEPNGSMFIVFRKTANSTKEPGNSVARNFQPVKSVQEIAGPWMVRFDPQWFYPTEGLSGDQARGIFVFGKLDEWSQSPELAIKYFSGTAVYSRVFTWSGDSRGKHDLFLDLGTVKETARVKLNGKVLGVVWCPPWRVEITEALKTGENALEIEVVNQWPNRLVGDAKLLPEQRRTKTNIPTNPNQPLLSSGLLGPVTLCEGAWNDGK